MGYDNVEQWQALLRCCATEIAQQMQIPWKEFRWYAAFHNESSHPHIHMVCYSQDGKSGFLTTKGIENIKSKMVKEIFRHEMTEIYAEQTLRRNKLTLDAEERLKELIEQMQSGELESTHIMQLMEELSLQLKTLSGKKQYGYLKAPVKKLVDEIVDELAKDERVKVVAWRYPVPWLLPPPLQTVPCSCVSPPYFSFANMLISPSSLYINTSVNVKNLFRIFVKLYLAYFAFLRYTIGKGGGIL